MTPPTHRTIRLNPDDNVVVAVNALEPGTTVPEERFSAINPVPEGHKVASRAIGKGKTIRKYGQIIGTAARDIHAGDHVHTHNMEMVQYDRETRFGTEARPTPFVPQEERTVFQGIVRSDGRVATRNYIGVMATSACSASVIRFIAEAFEPEVLADYPNVDGVVPIVHSSGCGMADHGDGIKFLQRTLAGWARHPNFAGLLLVGHGCEINQLDDLTGVINIEPGPTFCTMNIQAVGGTRQTLQRGIDAVKEMLPEANRTTRQPVPISHLMIGLECGGSDAFSGITANPALGSASDLVVRQGGTVILSETPEIYGAEQLLIQRVERKETGQKLLEKIRWWEEYTARNQIELNNNPSPGNKAGGLTTILEKSLGAVAKSGSTNLMEVYGFAVPITSDGLVFMDTPGYGMVSVTGMVAGGATMVCFTTGRGSVYGSKPVPTIKLATNTNMFRAMEEDMDVNCGPILDGEVDVEEMGRVIFQEILDTASGRKTKSELLGFGDSEFMPWQIGATI